MEKLNIKNRFLISCVSCIVLLLTLCYFGINLNFKGTSAASTMSCGSKYAVRYGQNVWCCPSSSDKIVSKNDKLYCIGENVEIVSAQNDQGWACQTSIKSDVIDEQSCPNQLGEGWFLIQITGPVTSPYTHLCSALPETCATTAVAPKHVYSISYDFNGGTAGKYAPKEAFIDETVNISNPTKKYTVNFDLNDSGASIDGPTSKTVDLIFQTWFVTNNSSSAQYSVDGTTWLSYNSASDTDKEHLTATKYKNLADTGQTVILKAMWSGVEINLPKILSSDGSTKTCKWYTNADGSGKFYESGLSSLTVGTLSSTTSMTLYAICGKEVCFHTPKGDYLWLQEEKPYPGAYDGYVVVPGINSQEDCSALSDKSDVPDDDDYVCFDGPAEGQYWERYGDYKDNPNYRWLRGVERSECEVVDEKFEASVPSESEYCVTGLKYNGKSQTIVDTKKEKIGFEWISGTTRTNAGSQDVTAKLLSGYKWNDGSTSETKTITCSIAKATPTITVSKNSLSLEKDKTGTFTISGSVVGDFKITSGSTSKATVSPSKKDDLDVNTSQTITVTGVSAGTSTITVSFTPNDTNNYNMPNSKTVKVTVTEPAVTTKTAIKPTTASHCVNVTYDKKLKTLTKSAGEGYTFSGNTGTNAGSYTVTATLNSGYVWDDGKTDKITFVCSIAKANAKLELTDNTTSLKIDDSIQIIYSYDGDGNVSCEPKNNKIAVCEVKDGKLVITAKAAGNTEILLKAAAGDNYNAASSKTVSVTVEESTSGGEELTESTFTVDFVANGGVLSGVSSRTCTTTSTSCDVTDLPSATRDGYTFNGWGLVETCDSGELSKITLDKNKTYYACWVKNANTPIVDDDGNVEDNVQTGNVVIMLILCLGLLAIGYAYYYFKSIKQK